VLIDCRSTCSRPDDRLRPGDLTAAPVYSGRHPGHQIAQGRGQCGPRQRGSHSWPAAGIINADAAGPGWSWPRSPTRPWLPTADVLGRCCPRTPVHARAWRAAERATYGKRHNVARTSCSGIGNRGATRQTRGMATVHQRADNVRERGLEPTQIGRVLARTTDRLDDRARRDDVKRGAMGAQGRLPDRRAWASSAATAGRPCSAHPISTECRKPQRVYEEMNRAFGPEAGYVHHDVLSQIAGSSARLPAAGTDHAGQGARWAGPCRPTWAC